MAYQFLEKTQIPAFILILVVMSHRLIELHGSRRSCITYMLVERASRICSPNKLSSEINFIKNLASWNGFTRSEGTDNADSP